MSIETDMELAIKIGAWLGARTGLPVGITTLDTGVIEITYDLAGQIQPPARIEHGKTVFPQGTDFNLMMAFLGS